jgi:hypothetical protein
VEVHGAQLFYLINHVHHKVWHNIKERWQETHLKLAKSLCDELFLAWKLSFVDNLLGDEVEEVTEACDDHLNIL